MRYLKVTNAKENHHGFQYRDGLNIDTQPFLEEGSCVPGGLYFTDADNIHRFYDFGVWVREIHLPKGRPDFKIVKDGNKWRASCLVLDQKVSLLDPSACQSFGIPIPCMEYLSKSGSVAGLQWYKASCRDLTLKYNSGAIDNASAFGQTAVLDWWKASGLQLKYTSKAMNCTDQVAVLEWWKHSGLPLKYTSEAMDTASGTGRIAVLDWWKASGLELKYTDEAMVLASGYGYVAVLDWWKSSYLTLKHKGNNVQMKEGEFSREALDMASANGFVAVLEWWKQSGLELFYTVAAVDLASCYGHLGVLEWWIQSGLEFKYTPDPIYLGLYNPYNIAVSNWWKKSGLFDFKGLPRPP